MNERKLILEVWEDIGENGERLPSLIYAGPLGEESRLLLGPNARMITTIEARCHFEAMTIYYRFMGWGEYTTDQSWDYQPYPEQWVVLQEQAALREHRA